MGPNACRAGRQCPAGRGIGLRRPVKEAATAGPYILFADGDPDTCVSGADVLNDFGYRADVVGGGGEAALALVRCRPYPLALLDYRMPDMAGAECFRRMRDIRPGIAGVIVTGLTEGDTLRAAEEAGVRHVLSKPVKFDELMPLVEEMNGTPG